MKSRPPRIQLDPLERELADRLEDAAMPMHWVGADGTILWANRAELELLGYPADEYIGSCIHDMHVDPSASEEILARLMAGETLHAFSARLRAKDGSIRHVLFDSNGFFRDGAFVHTRTFTRDVTELTRTLHMTEARFRQLMDHAPVGIFVTDAGGDCRFVNARWQALAGLSEREARGNGWVRAVHPEDRERVFEAWYEAARQHREFVCEYRFQTPAGKISWLAGRSLPLRGERGELEGYLGSVTDITERKLADDAREVARQLAERVAERMARLHAITTALATAVDSDTIVEIVVAQGSSAVGASIGALYLVEGERATLRRSHPEGELEPLLSIAERTPLGDALRTGPMYLESGRDYASRYAERLARDGEPTALACLPMFVDKTPLGVVTFAFEGTRRFEPDERSFLELLAYHCGQALERAQLLEAERRARREAESNAQRLGLLAQASRALAAAQHDPRSLLEVIGDNVLSAFADSCSVLTVSDDGTHLVPAAMRMRDAAALRSAREVLDQSPVPIGATTPGIVAQTGEPALIPVVDQAALIAGSRPEYAAHLRRFPIHSLLVVPIRGAGEILGVIVATRTSPERPFTEDDRALASDVADRAGLAMAHARAFDAERRARERLTRLHALIGPLARATTVEEVGRLTVAEGCGATGATVGVVYVREADGRLRSSAQLGVAPERARELAEVGVDDDHPVAFATRTLQPIWIENLEEFAVRWPALLERVPSAKRSPAFAVVPLIAESRCLGAVAFGYSGAHRFSDEERTFLFMIAHHAAHALHRAELLQRAEDAAHRAEEASRLKDEFLATVSHELRTPLSAILGWSAILRSKRGAEPQVIARAAEVIERNGQAQLRIIEDILDVSRIIRGQLRLEQTPVDLDAIARDVVDSLRPSASAKQITIELPEGEHPCRVIGDADRLRQILWNLLSNSVKFTPQGGSVKLELAYDGKRLSIVVSDTGCGIEPEFLPHVFERFRQQQGGMSRAHGGLGLGLAIVRHLTEMHGGTVQVESEGAGKGAKFTVLLPVRPFTAATAVAEQTAGGATPLSELRVLVVEDDPDARELIKVLLSSEGANVCVAAAADEALGTLGGFRPDVVVSDIAMPDRDGYSLVEALKRLHPTLPVVALTAYGSPIDADRARNAGFDHYFVKPLDPTELVDVLARYRPQESNFFEPTLKR